MIKLKLAFIGGGLNSAVGSAHFAALNIDNNFELCAGFFSRNKKINLETAQKYKIDENRLYYSIDELIDNEKKEIDAIVILSPTDQHYTHVVKCLQNEIPVICEKALAISSKEINEIQKILLNKKGFLSVIYNYLGYPIIRELRNMIRNEDFGKILHIQIEMPQESFIKKDDNQKPIIPQKWRMEDKSISTVSLDLGVHLHIINKYLIDKKPLKTVAVNESLGNLKNVTIDNVNCLIQYEDDILCNMWYSKIASGNRNGMKIRIYGSKGSAEWIQENPELLYMADDSGKRWTVDRTHPDVKICNQKRYERFKAGHPAGFIEAFANYYNDIAEALMNYKKTGLFKSSEIFGINESYEGLKLFEAVDKSNKEKKWIDIK